MDMLFGLVVGLVGLLGLILFAWAHYEISSGEKQWEEDKGKYLTYLWWLKKGYYGVKFEG